MMRAAGTLVLCGAFLVGASSPATAAAPPPKVQLKIVDSVKGGPTKTVWLHCAPIGGTHPSARAACRLLQQVKGDPRQLNVAPNASCTQEVKPHAVVVVGRWFGKRVHWAKVFSNGCVMRAATGAVTAL
ncbi:Subtilisin inhibitor-like [Nonomuraea solani]|uniref:Subtilisin inhibitor-like n=1 Tax=Nonomuraea solani TaxID=1144553 RepID=A0A1H5ZHX6_9ACTN|nr:SSI family serine proteinase inhibitor [Nonomuraea solani]SEG35634.1 Subtilisin inhibitor-like [Nonomuraea solani]